MNVRISLIAVTAVGTLFATPADSHFKLLEPASWINEDDRGDPQKLEPCGGTLADGGERSGVVTDVVGGQMLDVVVNETIYHPGHYRIALARRMNFLPADPQVTMHDTDRGLRSESAVIEESPTAPVLVDGLWPHNERYTGTWSTQIQIPNFDCENCVLQVIQFMAEHPGFREGGFSYHHCAMLNIVANEDLPVDARW